jgi:hypothetical protein
MFCTDSFIDVFFVFALKVRQHIPAEDIHVVCLGYLVPEMFDPDRSIRLTLCP